MASPFFLDTNIVVYAYDHRDQRKQQVARGILRDAVVNGAGVISSQVVQEFCNVMLRLRPPFIREDNLREILQQILAPLIQHLHSADFYLRAIRLYTDESLSFYDALIVQAALDIECTILYSEDLQAGRRFGGLVVVDPFRL